MHTKYRLSWKNPTARTGGRNILLDKFNMDIVKKTFSGKRRIVFKSEMPERLYVAGR